MTLSFIHCSDLHLGFNQFGSEQRFLDFVSSFNDIVDDAINRRVQYFLISGDLFNKRMINSRTLSQAVDSLKKLQDAGIKVVAIEGNHDKAPYGEEDSWMNFLSEQGYIYLLTPSFENGRLVLTEWDETRRTGTVLQLPGIRFVGLGYLGSMTARRLAELAETLSASDDFTVLLLHSAADRMLHLGGVKLDDFSPLREIVDYVALGHIHERYEVDEWLYNPGSPECWDLGEAGKEKGYYYVSVVNGCAQVEHLASNRRRVLRVEVDLSGIPTLETAYEKCRAAFESYQSSVESPVIVHLTIHGKLEFSPLALDMGRLQQEISESMPCVHVEIANQALDRTEHTENVDLELDRTVLERDVLSNLVHRELAGQVGDDGSLLDEAVRTALALKELGLANDEQGMADVIEKLAKKWNHAAEAPAVPLLAAAEDELTGGESSEDL